MRTLIAIGLLTLGALAAPMSAGPASAQTLDKAFIKSCQLQMDLSQAACTCVASRASSMLDAKSIAYLEIQANNGPAAAAAAKQLTAKETASIDHFMRTVPDQCSKG